ncbi:hypothetical protein HMPREF0322_04210 [Desulfitobacterium hafniense DP7]|uniref:Uncharacterized protein n=1 Tax=Desulfitobacterium hafniense DP7 TaxID=537010 RepID=G9XTA4_DESHA|nr:hypothetical protein HMPREF0322_04210 [Desulfitobacterium hafniense DP7]
MKDKDIHLFLKSDIDYGVCLCWLKAISLSRVREIPKRLGIWGKKRHPQIK